jgi:hypothetical protein
VAQELGSDVAKLGGEAPQRLGRADGRLGDVQPLGRLAAHLGKTQRSCRSRSDSS